ncbi:MAG: 4Fe-4S binding protein [Desulfovibrio sp.]|jgi:ferredoxin-type protein NapH|nr:4Fe-4S binding protein [Desulfovibrio sp.]
MKTPTLRFRRRLVQCGVAGAFILIPFLNREGIHLLSGNFLSFDFAGLPLADPLAAAQVFAGAFSLTQALLIGAIPALTAALLLGPVFCAWVCPYGLLSELVHRNFLHQGYAFSKLKRTDARPLAVKTAVVCAGIGAILAGAPVPLLNQLSMPGWYSRAAQHLALYGEILPGAALMLLVVPALEARSGRRFWCLYLCPQSVLLALAGMLSRKRLRVRFRRRSCTCRADDRACLGACSLGLNPRTDGTEPDLLCSNCGDCIDICRTRGRALFFAGHVQRRQGSDESCGATPLQKE